MQSYPPLLVRVRTPRLELRGASDDLLDRLAPLVFAGKAAADPPPYDDPISLYEPNPQTRVLSWLQGVWRARGLAGKDLWRLSFAVTVDEEPVGMQDVVGQRVADRWHTETFSWLSRDLRGTGLGKEMRQAVLHLVFDGLGAEEATSSAFVDNTGSNGVSAALGYQRNGTDWATRQGDPGQLQRWRLTRQAWIPTRRPDIHLEGTGPCRTALGLPSH
ncbi:MAG TPA: GNAT family protein [Beutenbergiaceae bacterium]|nr:GNAT family protein [Beutenbergiaceae bacterium]